MIKNEKGYINWYSIGEIAILVISIAVIIFFITAFFGNLCLDFAAGSHRLIPTAIDTDIWGNYKVYYRTSEYTQNNQEDFYYIQKEDKELAEKMRECIVDKHGRT